MTTSKWDLIRNFVNSHNTFTKTSLRNLLNIRSTSNYTESQYISHLLKVGFIKRTSRGTYEKVYQIPNNISINQITTMITNKDKRDKYMTIIIRKQKLAHLNSL